MKKSGLMGCLGFSGALAIAFVMMGFTTTASAMQTCQMCNEQYQFCIASGGSSTTCWTCNNPTCPPPLSAKDKPAAKDHALATRAKDRRRDHASAK
ncbi:hypothetical protein GCM10027285_01080 [Oleiagrimonas citrea]|uniref:Uncharacterized protein n=1 Tax=Oleiagrimonas citrea TaxID=1665687 RepID=A0A846ZQU2_9GAMM|nr:hypothetical protein [Oleiagrimonas citrea]NKZ39859.1 hypothetical protein [Oleiagrimonas citrea]